MKNLFFISLLFLFFISYGQQGSNIDLDEVVNSAKIVPRIHINGLLYSFRERDTLVKKLLRSQFWDRFTEFNFTLEDYETGKPFSFKSKGPLRIFINNNELTRKHLFKTFASIRELNSKIKKIEIRTDQEKKDIEIFNTTYITENESIFNGQIYKDDVSIARKTDSKVFPVTHMKITANLDSNTLFNRASNRKRIQNIENEQASSIALEGVEIVEKITEDGVFAPAYVDGQLTFQKNNELTELARYAKRYKAMGLNEWGIDVNTDSWAVALRAHHKGPMSPDGLPILMPGGVSINNLALPLWVVDGTPLSEAPISVRSLTPLIREVKILKYSEASSYGARGAAGVIIINTRRGLKSGQNLKRSFYVKGKKNRELLTEFQKIETQFKLKMEQLKTQKKYAYENENIIRMDSFQRLLDKTLFKSYLYTANFAIRNSDYEVAPYLAYTKISDASLSLLDSVAKKLSPKVKKSRYGKKFISFLKERKEMKRLEIE
ncbi:MAG: hypothetical protein ACR2MI_00850 [Flavobacteriaceae bacterium]